MKNWNCFAPQKGMKFKMTERLVRELGDPILRKACEPVTEISPPIIELLEDMKDTLYAQIGAGLAAPQVGLAKRIFILDCGEGLLEFINPEILESSGEDTGPEACLSLPGMIGLVKRASSVKVKSVDRTGKEIVLRLKGFAARCLQHELDHLDGILYVDRVKPGQLYDDLTNQALDVSEIAALSGGGQIEA